MGCRKRSYGVHFPRRHTCSLKVPRKDLEKNEEILRFTTRRMNDFHSGPLEGSSWCPVGEDQYRWVLKVAPVRNRLPFAILTSSKETRAIKGYALGSLTLGTAPVMNSR